MVGALHQMIRRRGSLTSGERPGVEIDGISPASDLRRFNGPKLSSFPDVARGD